MNRRSFLRQSAKIVGGAMAMPWVLAAASRCEDGEEKRMGKGLKSDSGSEMILPFLEVSGTNYEIGFKIGKRFGENIREGFRRRKKWFGNLNAIATTDFPRQFKGCVASAKEHFPQFVEEIRGWADGSDVPFEDLMVINMWAELTAMKRSRGEGACSTLSLNDGKRIVLAHNEDSSAAYKDLMFWLKAKPRKGRSFQCLCYPCFIPGNSPGFNDAGIIQTTNYIPASEWRVGIPRYILNRAIFDAKTLAEAVKTATHPERGYGNHHNLASRKERRILSLEVTPSKHEVHDVRGVGSIADCRLRNAESEIRNPKSEIRNGRRGVYFHTNHLILGSMKDQPQFPGKSSLTRYAVLKKETKNWKDATKVRVSDIVGALSSHERKPNSVCRHATGHTGGATLAMVMFEIPRGTFRVYKNNPCLGNFSEGRL